MKNLLEEYERIKIEDKKLKERKLEIECAIYEKHIEVLNSKDKGTFNIEDSGYKIEIIKKETVKVDDVLAEVVGIGFTKKYSLDKKTYNKLDIADKKRVDECLTIFPAKPSFSVTRLEE